MCSSLTSELGNMLLNHHIFGDFPVITLWSIPNSFSLSQGIHFVGVSFFTIYCKVFYIPSCGLSWYNFYKHLKKTGRQSLIYDNSTHNFFFTLHGEKNNTHSEENALWIVNSLSPGYSYATQHPLRMPGSHHHRLQLPRSQPHKGKHVNNILQPVLRAKGIW